MLENLVFYNHWQNGDIHLSRQLVRYVMSIVPAKNYIYCHKNSARLLQDIPNLLIDPTGLKYLDNDSQMVFNKHKMTVCLNTWYGTSPIFSGTESCTLNTLHASFKDMLKKIFGFEMTLPVTDFLPQVDYSHFHLETINQYLKHEDRPKILVSNGPVTSGQADNFSFDSVIDKISDDHPDKVFLVTNNTDRIIEKENVQYTREIIRLNDNDLNENGYLSHFCDVIIGRSSGAYIYSMTRENLLSDKKYVCFCDDKAIAEWVHPNSSINSDVTWSNSRDVKVVSSIIEEVLEKEYDKA